MAKILIVEDDSVLLRGLMVAFRREGHDLVVATDGERGYREILESKPDLVILDIMLPSMNGFEVITEVRRRGNVVPILVLSARDQVNDKVRGLDLGADDYVTKPFELEEIQARVRRMLGRKVQTEWKFGAFTYDASVPRLLKENIEIALTPKEHGVLKFLLSRKTRLTSREELIENIWGADFDGTDRTVDTCICTLRRKLGKGHVVTVRGSGYRLETHPAEETP